MSEQLCITLIVLSMFMTGLFVWLAGAEGVRLATPPEPGQKPKISFQLPLIIVALIFCVGLVVLLYQGFYIWWNNDDYYWMIVIAITGVMVFWYWCVQEEWVLPKRARIGYATNQRVHRFN